MVSTFAAFIDDSDARAEAEVALRRARELGNPSALAAALCAQGAALADREPDAALAAFDECIALGRQGANQSMFSMALSYASSVRARSGDLRRAARELREGVEGSQQIGSRSAFYSALWSGVETLTALDHWVDAGVFDGIVGTGMPEESRAGAGDVARRAAAAQARAVLGPERYDEAVRTGAAMTYEQAVEHTLRVLDDLIADPDPTAER